MPESGTEARPPERPSEPHYAAEIRRSRGLPLIWILPLVTAMIAAWLLYQEYTEGDLRAHILFQSGEGLMRGKTVVKYAGVEIGVVRDFKLVPSAEGLNGGDGVLAEIEFNRSAEYLLVEGTEFWLVKPEFSITGVRGLETLLSGNYIAMSPGSGASTREFVAVERPPASVRGEGLRVVLKAPRLGSLNRGSPVYYRQLRVGQIEDYHLSANDNLVEVDLFIHQEFAHLVHRGSRFWNVSGLSVEGGIGGVTINLESLAALVAGGVSFHTPENQRQSPLAVDGAEFRLYDSFADADAGIKVKLNFDRGVNVQPGSTTVVYQGVQVGKVTGVKASREAKGMQVDVLMDPITDDLLSENTRFWMAAPTLDISSGLGGLLQGNRIEVDLRRGNRSVRSYAARASAPQRDPRVPGLHLQLTARSSGSLTRGAGVYYRRIEVGKVQGMELNETGDGVIVYVVIEPHYAHLVTRGARFWNISGLRASAGLSGVEIEADSLLTLVRGGIAFGVPRGEEGGSAAQNGENYPLYSSREAALEEGVRIRVYLPDASGLREGSALRYKGVQVGEITRLRLGADLTSVRATAKLYLRGEKFARNGTRFWVVSPKVGLEGVANLETLIGGRYLALEPGDGPVQTEFTALAEPPEQNLAETMMQPGLTVILDAPRRGSLSAGSPVYYRQVQIGEVTGFTLGELADRVYIYVHIEPCYQPLVRENTVFWNASGVDVNFGLRTGVTVNTESAQALIAGGLALATPEAGYMGREVESGSHYPLYPKAKPEWLLWSPKIEICSGVGYSK